MASPSAEVHGTALEENVRQVAARLGVADFVYTATPVAKGPATREADGDGLLISNGLGAVLQVKSREPAAARTDEAARAESWIKKNAFRARDQGRGTKRELNRLHDIGTPLKAYPVRAAELPESRRERYVHEVSGDARNWPTIVVLDHAQATGLDLGFEHDTFWVTFEDWCALQLRLRSTTGILRYVSRVLSSSLHVPLGNELARYAALREADVQASSGRTNSLPYLPDVNNVGSLGTDLFHDVIDQVWHDDGDIPWSAPEQYRAIVEFLDDIPPSLQTIAGDWFLRKRAELAAGQWRSSGLAQVRDDRLVYACTDLRHWDDSHGWQAEFGLLTMLRHSQAIETGAPTNTVTLGVGALVEKRGTQTGVSYFFVLLRGANALSSIPADLRRSFEHNYGIHNHRKRTTSQVRVGRNEPCPCMSGRKFKKCCG